MENQKTTQPAAFESPKHAAECQGKFIDYPKLAAWASEKRSSLPLGKKDAWRLEVGTAWMHAWECGPRFLVPGFEFVIRRLAGAGALRRTVGWIPFSAVLSDVPTDMTEETNVDPTFKAALLETIAGAFLESAAKQAKEFLDATPVTK
jgi:hypothetical protein